MNLQAKNIFANKDSQLIK